MARFVYIHGFNSSPSSFKARLMQERLAALGRAGDFSCPALSHSPGEAMQALEQEISACRKRGAAPVLVGSSLGGFYATVLAETRDLAAVLVNPAVAPYDLLAPVLGPQKNLYTGEEYELTGRHLQKLRAMEVPAVAPGRYLLLLGTADETLDYRDALAKYAGSELILIQGGDHGLAAFADHLDRVIAWGDARAGPADRL